jgi:exonuclease III
MVASVVTGCGLLNVVSINVNHIHSWLYAINCLMTKKNWHVVLVQETGVISKVKPNLHTSIQRNLHNHIFFNSPHYTSLKEKQYNAKILELTRKRDSGTLDADQFDTQSLLALGRRVYPSSGLAVMVNHSILDKVQTHRVSHMSKHGHLRRSKRLMAILLSVNGSMTCIINGYALARGSTIVNDWINKCVLLAILECQSHNWNVIFGGDFNAALFPIDHGNPSLHKECWALVHLLTEGGLLDSFRAVNPTASEFTWTKLIKCKHTGAHLGLMGLEGSCLDHIMTFLPPVDRVRLASSGRVFHDRYRRPVIQQKRIDLILVSSEIRIAAAHVAHDVAIDSDHAPVLLSVPLSAGDMTPAVQEYKSATKKFSSNRLTNNSTRNKFLAGVNAALTEVSCSSADRIGAVGRAMAKAASVVLPLLDHRRDSELVGVARRYAHKTIKVVNHVKRCMAQNVDVPVTRNMLQLAEAPNWARCPLPNGNDAAASLEYLHAATSAKKKARRQLDRARHKQDREGVNALVRYSALGSPKEVAQFWSKLRHRTCRTVTLSATRVIQGVATTYRNASSILDVFQEYWASLYSVAATPCPTSKPWFHVRPPPIPARKLAALTALITTEEFRAALHGTKNGAPGTDGVDAAMLKATSLETQELLRLGMNDILARRAPVPEEWKVARIVLIPKDGAPDNPANYRPISLLQVSYKIFTKILTNRLSRVANKHILDRSQLGFRKGMSAQSALRVMVDVLEDSKTRTSPTRGLRRFQKGL